MEVHGHHHSKGKKWTDYLWEFLMLFLAVFCGFLAENIREHGVEKERERQYIRSMIEDLGEDTVTFEMGINDLYPNIDRMDTLMHLLSSPNVKEHGADLYYLGRRASRGNTLALHDRTIQQMKNSGGFRLINNENVSRAILDHYNKLRFIDFLITTELNEVNEYRKIAISVFHPLIFDGTVKPDNSVIRPAGNPSLLTYDNHVLFTLANMVSFIKNTRIALANAEVDFSLSAKRLITLLRQEYHLKSP